MDPAETSGPSRSEALRQLLEERRRQVLAQIQRGLTDHQTAAQERGASGSHGWAAAGDNPTDLALMKTRGEALAQIDAALARLRAGAYGRCAECDEEIPLPRLRALPFALRCAPCQERWEGERG